MGKHPGVCFPTGDNASAAAYFPQTPVDDLTAAMQTMNSASIPRVNVSVSSPAAAAAEAAEKQADAIMASPPKTSVLPFAAAALAALFLLK